MRKRHRKNSATGHNFFVVIILVMNLIRTWRLKVRIFLRFLWDIKITLINTKVKKLKLTLTSKEKKIYMWRISLSSPERSIFFWKKHGEQGKCSNFRSPKKHYFERGSKSNYGALYVPGTYNFHLFFIAFGTSIETLMALTAVS